MGATDPAVGIGAAAEARAGTCERTQSSVWALLNWVPLIPPLGSVRSRMGAQVLARNIVVSLNPCVGTGPVVTPKQISERSPLFALIPTAGSVAPKTAAKPRLYFIVTKRHRKPAITYTFPKTTPKNNSTTSPSPISSSNIPQKIARFPRQRQLKESTRQNPRIYRVELNSKRRPHP